MNHHRHTIPAPARLPRRGRAAVLGVILGMTLTFGADAKTPEPVTAPGGATEYRDVRYLPAWRYTADTPAQGAALPQRDAQQVMDIVVPDDGKDQHPVLFAVHGGGWSAGFKDEKIYRQIMAYFVERGYVVVGYNYILRQRGVFPQVFWDDH